MTDEKKPSGPKPSADDKGTAAPKITRRRFTKAGAIAPVVMTLGARPVWGQTCSFSGQLSGNEYATSAPAGTGYRPSYWDKLSTNLWPTYNGERVQPSDPIDPIVQKYDTCDYFIYTDKQGNLESYTFNELLKLSDGAPMAEAAAAVLNVLNGNYGYGFDGLMSFLCSTENHAEALDVLICLNSRP